MNARKFDWREDSSNQERSYRRNDVRLGLIPTMEEVAGGSESLKRRILALGQQSIELHEWLRKEATNFLDSVQNEQGRKNDRLITILVDGAESKFSRLPPMVQSEALHLLCSRLTGSSTDYAQMKRVAALALEDVRSTGAKSKSLRLSDEWLVTKIGSVLRFEQKSKEPGHHTEALFVRKILRDVSIEFDSSVFAVDAERQDDGEEQGAVRLSLQPGSTISVRLPRPGDSFQPPWKPSPIKVTDFLRGAGVPVEDRDLVILILVDQRVAALLQGSRVTYSSHARSQQQGTPVNIALHVSLL
jgi:hypothetical protein